MATRYIATHTVEDAHKSDIFAIAAGSKYTASTAGDGVISLWENFVPKDPIQLTEPRGCGVHHIAMDITDTFMAAVYFDGSVRTWSLESLEEIVVPAVKDIEAGWACSIANDALTLAVSTVEGSVLVFDLQKKELVSTLKPAQNQQAVATCVDISSDGKFVACGLDSGRVHVYSTATGRLSYTLPCHTMSPRAVKLSPMNTLVAVAGDSETISLFTLNGGDLIGTFVGHDSWVFALDWNLDGSLLLSVSQDGKAKIWSIEDRACVSTLNDSDQPLFAGAYIRNGHGAQIIGGASQGVVTGGIDRTLRWYREASSK